MAKSDIKAGWDAEPALPLNPANAVEVEGISKRYRVATGDVGRLSSFFLYRFASSLVREELWALSGVSFEVPRGTILGIVGVNGSGKSTLLRVITGITAPTAGEVRRPPRVGALLDMSVGFHPGLTGYENLFLGASLLGIPREELRARLGDITEFSGIEPEYLETPVRYYSTGMLTRLGFSLAVHTDPDVVLLDEVLAVGDSEFQTRSARRLLRFAEEGKAMIVVSHVVEVVQQLSTDAMWLHGGKVRQMGPPDEVLRDYRAFLNGRIEAARGQAEDAAAAGGTGLESDLHAVLSAPALLPDGNKQPGQYETNGTLRASVVVEARRAIENPDLVAVVLHDTGAVVEEFAASERGVIFDPLRAGERVRVTINFEPLLLLRGRYALSFHLVERGNASAALGHGPEVWFEVNMPYTALPVYCASIPAWFSME